MQAVFRAVAAPRQDVARHPVPVRFRRDDVPAELGRCGTQAKIPSPGGVSARSNAAIAACAPGRTSAAAR
ncbi:MAG: hypothetical protein RSF79_06795 [Janthinobacterium sp.]